MQDKATPDNQIFMTIKEQFWNDISNRLEKTYILKTHPTNWKKRDVENFIIHFKDTVSQYRSNHDIASDTEVSISYDTFRRILIKNETSGSEYTRNLFAQYFGENTYMHYVRKISSQNEAKQQFEAKTSSSFTKIILLAVPVLFLCMAYFYATPGKNTACIELENTVRAALKAELASYQSVPKIENSVKELKKYFWEDNQAFKSILQVLENEKKRNWILSNESNISSAELLDFNCEYVNDDIATITTKEHWVIQWFDTNISEYAYLYDTINTQIYYLRKDGNINKWKISINNYGSKKERILPKIFEDNTFEETISTSDLKRKIILFMSSGDSQSAIWWLYKYAETNSLPILNEVVLLKGRLNNNIRRVNTFALEMPEFYSLNKEIDEEILKIMKKL